MAQVKTFEQVDLNALKRFHELERQLRAEWHGENAPLGDDGMPWRIWIESYGECTNPSAAPAHEYYNLMERLDLRRG